MKNYKENANKEYAKNLKILLNAIRKFRRKVLHRCDNPQSKGKIFVHNVASIRQIEKHIRTKISQNPRQLITKALQEGEIYGYKGNMGLIPELQSKKYDTKKAQTRRRER